MKKINKLISTIAVVALLAVGLINGASAAVDTYSADTTVDLTDSDFTILSGSTDGGLVVNANSIVVTLAAGDYFVVTSTTRGITVTGSVSGVSLGHNCSSGLVDTVILNSVTGAGSYTLAPSASQCTYTGGGGGGSNPTPTPTATPTATSTPTVTPVPTPTPSVVPGPATPAAPSGVTLYRVAGEHRVYVIKDGKKTWVKTAEEFTAAGYRWGDITEVSSASLAAFPDTVASSLIRAIGDSKVYIIADGKKTWIKTAEEFTAAGYKWSDILETTVESVASYPDASAISVKVVGTPTLRVRKSYTTASAILGSVKRNEVYTVIEKKNKWYKITMKSGTIGWISGAYTTEQ